MNADQLVADWQRGQITRFDSDDMFDETVMPLRQRTVRHLGPIERNKLGELIGTFGAVGIIIFLFLLATFPKLFS